MKAHGRIKLLRKKNNLTQSDIASSLNMSQNAYSLLESGKTKIDLDRLYQIARFYKISIYDLIVEESPPPPKKNELLLLLKSPVHRILYLPPDA
ncbi:MAG: helix-turn-helix domain-containing protein [Bacteroidota bacterium]